MPAPTPERSAPSPLREALTIALPVAAVMVSYTLSQFVDAIMVGRLPNGDEAVAALGNGGVVAWVPVSVVMACVTVINTYVSQHIGAGRPREAATYPWNGAWLAAATWALVLVPIALAIPALMPAISGALSSASEAGGGGRIATSPAVAAMQQDYARILLLGSVATLAARAMSQFFFGVHRGGVILLASIVANAVNAFLNYLLIYGSWGFPALGVSGAAYATVIGQSVEFLIPFAVFLSPGVHREFGSRSAWRPSARRLRQILSLGWPQGLMFGSEMVCWAVFMVAIVGSVSVADNAAGWIGLRYMQLSFMPAFGVSVAVTALVGRHIGAGRPDVAEARAWLCMRIAMVYMGACAIAFVLFRESLVRLFVSDGWNPQRAQDVVRIGAGVMLCAAVFQLFDAIGIILVGALRGAGDTRIPGLATVVLSWGLIIGGGFGMLRLAPQWGSIGPWCAASAYIITFALFMLARFRSGRWRAIRLVDPAAIEPAPRLDPAVVP